MNPIDIGLIIIIAIGFLAGISLGFLRLILPFVAAAAIWAVLRFQPEVAILLQSHLEPELAQGLAYIVVANGTLILTGILGTVLRVFIKITLTGWFDRLVGSAAGLAIGVVLAALVVIGLESFGGPEIQRMLSESVLADPLRDLWALGLKELQKYKP